MNTILPKESVFLPKFNLYVCPNGKIYRISKINAYGHSKGEPYELPQHLRNGYLSVSCHGVNYSVHRLIAEAFIPNPNGYETVDHCDRDKLNNSIQNLRWCSWSDQETNRSNVIKSKETYGVRASEDHNAYERARQRLQKAKDPEAYYAKKRKSWNTWNRKHKKGQGI